MDRKAVDAWFMKAARAAWSAGAAGELSKRAGVSDRQARYWLDGSRSVKPAVADRLGVFLVQHAARLRRLAAALPLGPESATAQALAAVGSARPEALALLDKLPPAEVDEGWSDPFTWPAVALDAEIARVAALPPLPASPEDSARGWAFNEAQDVAARAAAPAPSSLPPMPGEPRRRGRPPIQREPQPRRRNLDPARIQKALEAKGITVCPAPAAVRVPRGSPLREMLIREEAAKHAAGRLVYQDELAQHWRVLPENEGLTEDD